uniref:helix-turn-helix domain-containing protein n=1 Tax=Flavobacterium sp. TaxID=239 RepID=UPI00404B7BE6
MPANHQIGFKIKQLRNKNKISQLELAEQLYISQSSLSSIENGETEKVDFLLMQKICEIFNITPEYFFETDQNNTYNINENKGSVTTNHYGDIYQCPDKLINKINELIKDYKKLD